MVEFIHADVIVEIRGCPLRQTGRIEGLDADKQVIDVRRFSSIHVELAEIEIIQNLLDGLDALLQNLLSVGDEQKPCSLIGLLKTLVVKGSYDGFSDTRTCQGSDQCFSFF